MVKGHKTGGRQKGTPNRSTLAPRSTLSDLQALALKAEIVERKANQAEAERRNVAAEYKAAAQVLAPALAALRAAVTALEALMGPPSVARIVPKRRAANGEKPAEAPPLPRVLGHPSDTPPVIRQIRTIITEDGVKPAEAKRIQEREIVARAEWHPSNIVLNGGDPTADGN